MANIYSGLISWLGPQSFHILRIEANRSVVEKVLAKMGVVYNALVAEKPDSPPSTEPPRAGGSNINRQISSSAAVAQSTVNTKKHRLSDGASIPEKHRRL
ncbi:hypothetical protein CBS101457_001548 [Exobasidium rhododendri]|nr:hypothetical protein CBS101457_001548 [Exobasidium rhododendri]